MTIERSFRKSLGLAEPELTVTREAGTKVCVLTVKKDNMEFERITTSNVSIMQDYLRDWMPGKPVRWRLLPPGWAKEVA
jgi:hypothetical protein